MRSARGALTHIVAMTTVRCETCGFQYVIEYPAGAGDAELAQRQAHWLAERFVWDHIQENKHTGSIPLPILPQVTAAH